MAKSKVEITKAKAAGLEIDDIFSSKSAQQPDTKASKSSSSSKGAKAAKVDKVDKARGGQGDEGGERLKRKRDAQAASSNKRAVQIVTDTSSTISNTGPQSKLVKAPSKSSRKDGAFDAAKQAELDDFANSRGSDARKRTDDGLRIFSATELGINDQGGDTPLCPFDCNCCF